MIFTFEEEMRPHIHTLFKDREYEIFDEATLFRRRVDVVAKKGNELCTVEMKVNNWRRAIEQACLNLRVADYSYVALPEPILVRMGNYLLGRISDNGLGLIGVNGMAKEIMEALPSERIQPLLRQRFVTSLPVG